MTSIQLRRALLLFCLACAPPLCAQQAEPPPAVDCERDPRLAGLLDPEAAPAVRRTAVAALEEHAAAGKAWARYQLGSLLRAGDHVPDNPVERDLDRAATLLSNTIHHGSLNAMLKLAELELDRDRPLDANVWLQVFFTVALEFQTEERSRGYEASLLHRARAALDGSGHDQADVVAYANAFLAQHGERIWSGMQAVLDERKQGAVRPRSNDRRILHGPLPKEAGLAEFVLGVDASGSVARVLLLDTMPDPRVGRYLARAAHRMSYEVDAGAGCVAPDGLRYVLQTFAFDDRRFQVRTRPSDGD